MKSLSYSKAVFPCNVNMQSTPKEKSRVRLLMWQILFPERCGSQWMSLAMEGQTFAQLLPQPGRTSGKLSVNLGVKQVNAPPQGWGMRWKLLIQLQTLPQYSFQLQKCWVLSWFCAGTWAHCSQWLQSLSKHRLDLPARPAARPAPAAEEECTLQPWDGAAWIHFPRAFFGGCFCLSSSPICICYFAIPPQKRLLSNSSLLQALAGCSLPPDMAGTLLQLRGMSHFSTVSSPLLLLPVHRDICETQKDESFPINCQASADTSCHTTDRTEFIKINLNNQELRILLNSKRSICSLGEVFWKSPSMGISPWFPSAETVTFIMIKTCLPERGLIEWRI